MSICRVATPVLVSILKLLMFIRGMVLAAALNPERRATEETFLFWALKSVRACLYSYLIVEVFSSWKPETAKKPTEMSLLEVMK